MNTKTQEINRKMFFRAVIGSSKLFVTLISMVALTGSQLLFIGVKTTQAQNKQRIESTKSQFRSAATQYDRAAGQIRAISTRSLTTRQELDKAISTLQQNRAAIDRGPFPKLVNMATNNAAFKQAVEAEAKRVGYEKLYQQLKSNPSMVMNFAGARQLQSSMRNELRQQANHFRTLGNNLKAAQDRFESESKKQRQNSSLQNINNNPYITSFVSYTPPVFDSKTDKLDSLPTTDVWDVYNNTNELELSVVFIPEAITIALIAAAVVIIGAAAAAAAVLIKAYVEVKVEDFTDPDDGDGVSDYKKCTDAADAKLDQCLNGISNIPNNLPFWEKAAREAEKAAKIAGCWSVYTLRKADCLLLPQ